MKLNEFLSRLAFFLVACVLLAACRPGAGPDSSPTGLPADAALPTAAPTLPAELPENPSGELPGVEPPAAAQTPESPPPLPDSLWPQALREAVAAAVDREMLVGQALAGQHLPAYHLLPPGSPFSAEPFRERYGARNLELAVELLSGAGFSPERRFSFELWYPQEGGGEGSAGGTLEAAARALEAQLEETGMVELNLNQAPWSEFSRAYRAGELPAYLLTWSPDYFDADTWLSPFVSCEGSASLGAGYCSPQMDELLARAAVAGSPQERAALYAEIGALIAEEAPVLPLFWEPDSVAYREGVQGIEIGPTAEFHFNLLHFDEDYQPASGARDTVLIGTTDRVVSLDPNDAYTVHDWEILKNTGVPLLRHAPGGDELVPGAAELPEVSADGRVYTFRLIPGIRYADGSALLAQDYVYAFQRLSALNGEVSSLVTRHVASVEALDQATLAVTLQQPYSFFPALAASAAFVPANPAEFSLEALNPAPGELNGIGPYRMVEHLPGERLVLEANPHYFGQDGPQVPNVIVRYFDSPGGLSQALESGEIDVAWRSLGPVEVARLQALQGSSGLVVQEVEALTLYLLVFNHNLP